jgi:hypothetical protein
MLTPAGLAVPGPSVVNRRLGLRFTTQAHGDAFDLRGKPRLAFRTGGVGKRDLVARSFPRRRHGARIPARRRDTLSQLRQVPLRHVELGERAAQRLFGASERIRLALLAHGRKAQQRSA